ncbi:MAG: hypothetical protein JSS72_09995 [Armatimonadetes bacterium]|nr:hypothetical protein [Armatimonadota bacterium]
MPFAQIPKNSKRNSFHDDLANVDLNAMVAHAGQKSALKTAPTLDGWRDEFIHRAYESQLSATNDIFWVVIVALVIGFGSGIWQLFAGVKVKGDETEIEVAMQSLKLKTKSLGVVIMFASIAMFFMYLKIVYPINDH